MSDVVKAHASRVAHRAQRALKSALGHEEAVLTREDEDLLAAEYDAARGFARSRVLRSKEAHEHAAGAPVMTWPVLRRA
ncbi:hypothetical protein CFH99_15840 [Nocardioides aromaticivorans]|uniref:Uncharacterized protein n=1 Tax=Nocardioides aromaticivorans TaxID=200618 RepID=A0ABX7PN80_9ACTN|nr:hypothetical protein CFH99_15840 [Nocardioides aromaticivorans]